jgi:K+-sensing histidine kinase KdpD
MDQDAIIAKLQFSVTDTGSGIPKGRLASIFGAFT